MNPPRILVVGNVNVDLILGPQTPWPTPGTEVALPHRDLRPGGQAGNVALALEALNAPFVLLGNRGDDLLGDWLQEEFAHATAHWQRYAAPTSISVGITHPDRERTYFTHLGHLENVGAESVLPVLQTARAGEVLLLLGGFLTPKLRAAYPQLLALAEGQGLSVALDPGWPPQGWETCREEMLAWLPHCQHLLINEIEALQLAQADRLDPAASILQRHLPAGATLVIKRGAAGVEAWRGEEIAVASAPSVEVIDTIGAGDIFNAAYLTAQLEGQPLQKSLEAGVEVASQAISTFPRRYRRTL